MKKLRFNNYLLILISVCVLVLLSLNFTSYIDNKHNSEPKEEYDRLRSYLLTCYSSEGFYPPNLDYLKENYGLILKEYEFIYFYDAFSSNIKPDLIINRQFKERKVVVK